MDIAGEILVNPTSNKHDKDREKPFEPRVAGDVAKANGGERGGGEVKGGEVGVHLSCLRYDHHDHHCRCHDHHRSCHDHHEIGFHLGNLQAAVHPILCCKLRQPAGARTLNVHRTDHIPGICEASVGVYQRYSDYQSNGGLIKCLESSFEFV